MKKDTSRGVSTCKEPPAKSQLLDFKGIALRGGGMKLVGDSTGVRGDYSVL